MPPSFLFSTSIQQINTNIKDAAKFPRSHLPGSNWGPSLYKSVALPTELRWRLSLFISDAAQIEGSALIFDICPAADGVDDLAAVGIGERALLRRDKNLIDPDENVKSNPLHDHDECFFVDVGHTVFYGRED